MIHFMSRAMAIALLAVSTFALAANGQAPANNGPGQNPNQNKNQANDPTDKNKNQAPSDKAAAKDAERQSDLDKKHEARDARKSGDKNSQDAKNAQDQSKQNGSTQRNLSTAPQQNSAVLPGEQYPRGSSNPQPPANLQGGNQPQNSQPQNNQQIGRDQRDARHGSSTAHEHTALKPTDMRGPDIGLWFNHSNRDALVISDVSSHGPIARLGFREGDRIVSVNGHRLTGEPEFINYLLTGNEARVAVIVTRDGRDETIYVEPAQFTELYGTRVEPLEQLGIVLDDRYDDRSMVWRVIPRSPAYYAGIREGDVISTFDGHSYNTRTEFETSFGDMKAGSVSVQVHRGDKTRDLSVEVPEFERGAEE